MKAGTKKAQKNYVINSIITEEIGKFGRMDGQRGTKFHKGHKPFCSQEKNILLTATETINKHFEDVRSASSAKKKKIKKVVKISTNQGTYLFTTSADKI